MTLIANIQSRRKLWHSADGGQIEVGGDLFLQ